MTFPNSVEIKSQKACGKEALKNSIKVNEPGLNLAVGINFEVSIN